MTHINQEKNVELVTLVLIRTTVAALHRMTQIRVNLAVLYAKPAMHIESVLMVLNVVVSVRILPVSFSSFCI